MGREASADGNEGDSGHGPAAETLHRSRADDDPHGGRRAGQHETCRERACAHREGARGSVAIGLPAGSDDRGEVRQHVRAERHPVEAVTVQFLRHRGHGGDDCDRFDRVHGHRHHEAGGEGPQRGEPGATSGHGRVRSTSSARSKRRSSRKNGATICTPTGKPSTAPPGTEIAGQP